MPDEWPTAQQMMTADPVTADVNDTLSSALGEMRSKRIHELPVLKDGKLVGMVAYDALGRRRTMALSTKLEHVMVLCPTMPPSASYPEVADKLLSSGRRAGCVVDPRNGKLLGIVSRTDLVRVLPNLRELGERAVSEVMSPATTVLQQDDACLDVLAHIRELEDHPVPVKDGKDRLVGAVSITDMANAFWRTQPTGKRDRGESPTLQGVRVEGIMTRPALTVVRGSSAADAARVMTRNRASSVFVVDGEDLMGIVSQSELLSLAVRHGGVGEGVYIQISGLNASPDPVLFTDLDAVLSKGLKRVSRFETPRMLSVHVAPHASEGLGSVTVEARLHGPNRIYSASRTDFNLLKAAASVMDELERQVHGVRDDTRGRERAGRSPRRQGFSDSSQLLADPELDEKMRETLTPEAPRRGRSAPRRR